MKQNYLFSIFSFSKLTTERQQISTKSFKPKGSSAYHQASKVASSRSGGHRRKSSSVELWDSQGLLDSLKADTPQQRQILNILRKEVFEKELKKQRKMYRQEELLKMQVEALEARKEESKVNNEIKVGGIWHFLFNIGVPVPVFSVRIANIGIKRIIQRSLGFGISSE